MVSEGVAIHINQPTKSKEGEEMDLMLT